MIDYENVDPEILKEWDREYRNKCRREMTQYLKDFPDATPEEKRELSSWVRSGHSPYVNGDNIVNVQDLVVLKKYLASADLSAVSFFYANADVNQDGTVGVQDIKTMKAMLAGG